MTRLTQVAPEEASGPLAETYGQIKRSFGGVPNFMQVLASSPTTLGGFLQLHDGLAHGRLDVRTRERIALAMAEENSCQYCVSAHTALAKQVGLDDSEIEAARKGGSADAKADAAVRFATSILENRGEVTTAEIEAVRGVGFDDGEIVEIIANVAINTWTNFLGKSAQIDIDFPEIQLLSKAVA